MTVSGSNLGGVTSVTFGSVAAAFDVVSPTKLVVTVPPDATSDSRLTVSNVTGSTPVSFTVDLTITGFSPPAGAPGQVVTITGTGFGDVGVELGGQTMRLTGPHTATSLQVIVPSGTSGGLDPGRPGRAGRAGTGSV